jgi:RNA-binding protein
MELDDKQKKHLRGLAHPLKAIVQVGAAGITPTLMNELDQTLEHHELVKVRIRADNREERDKLVADIVEKTHSALVARIGNVAVLYRKKSDPSAAHK